MGFPFSLYEWNMCKIVMKRDKVQIKQNAKMDPNAPSDSLSQPSIILPTDVAPFNRKWKLAYWLQIFSGTLKELIAVLKTNKTKSLKSWDMSS